jgi:hypothetical protein
MADPSSRKSPRVIDVVLYFVGVAGIAAAITLLFLGMRPIMDVGGMCAEGGPYVIQQHCPEGSGLVYFLGFMGGTAAIFLTAWKGSSIGGGAGSVVFLAWPAAFGVIGFNFLQSGFDPPGEDPGWAWGWLTTGIVFEATAFGPLLLALLLGFLTAPADGGGGAAHVARATPGGQRLATTVAGARARRSTRRSAIEVAAPTTTGGAAPSPEAAALPGEGEAGAPPGEGAAGAEVLVDVLERLAALHEDGSLTDDEYSRAKADLLERAGA